MLCRVSILINTVNIVGIFLEITNIKGSYENAQTIQFVTKTICYSPQPDIKAPLLKKTPTPLIDLEEVKLVPT